MSESQINIDQNGFQVIAKDTALLYVSRKHFILIVMRNGRLNLSFTRPNTCYDDIIFSAGYNARERESCVISTAKLNIV